MKTQARIIAAAALLAGPVVYLTAEAISAAAWKNPTYSYTRDWISDLGSTTRGVFQSRLIDSPLHTVMNTGFILQGILYAAGTIALARCRHAGSRHHQRTRYHIFMRSLWLRYSTSIMSTG